MAAKLSPRPKEGGDKKPMAQRLTAQQELFIDALFERNFHLKDAAMQAGVSAASASQQACRWMQMPQVAAAIATKREALRNTKELVPQRLVQELARIALFNPKTLLRPDGKGMLDLKDMPDDVAAVITNISVTYGESENEDGTFTRLKNIRYSFVDKLGAISQLANMMGLNQGGAATVINTTNNTLNQVVVKFDELYKAQAALAALPPPGPGIAVKIHEDSIEAKIAALEAQASSLASPPDTASPPGNLKGKLNTVNSNE